MSVDILGQAVTNAEAWFSIALRPQKPEGSLGRTAQDVHRHLDSHTAPDLSTGRPGLPWGVSPQAKIFIMLEMTVIEITFKNHR